MSYRLVEQLQKKAVSVSQACRVLQVSQSGYYAARICSRQAPVACADSVHLKAAFAASGRAYGRRRLCAALQHQGLSIGRRRARTLMRANGLHPVWRRKFVHTTDSRHTMPVSPNVLALASSINRGPTKPGPATSPASARVAAGCTWRRCWTCIHARSSAGPWPPRCLQRWCARPCKWPSPSAIQPKVFLCIATG